MGFLDKIADKVAETLAKVAKPLTELALWIALIKDIVEATILETEAEGGTGAEKLEKATNKVIAILKETIGDIPVWIVVGSKLLICLINAAVYILNAKKILQGIRPQDN